MIIILIVAVVLALLKICRNIYNSLQYYDMRNFYSQVLEIRSVRKLNIISDFERFFAFIQQQDLGSYTWHEIQSKLLMVQTEHHLCIHKHNLTQLDIYHRILRFKNYEVAMVNKNVINLKFNLPFLGEWFVVSYNFFSGFRNH